MTSAWQGVMVDSLPPTTSARSKRPVHHDEVTYSEPMSAAARERKEIRRNPSTDQKKARRSQVRKMAERSERARVRVRHVDTGAEGEVLASADRLSEFDTEGPWHHVDFDDGLRCWVPTHRLEVLTGGRVAKTANGPDGYRMKRPGQGEWQDTGSTTYQGALEAARSLIDRAEPSTIVLIHNTFNDSVSVVDLDPLGGANSVWSYEQFYGVPYPADRLAAKQAARTNQVANFTRSDGLGLEEGDPVHVLGSPDSATFVSYDSVTDRVTIRFESGQTTEVSPDVLIPDDPIAATSRLTTNRVASIHDHILGHLSGGRR